LKAVLAGAVKVTAGGGGRLMVYVAEATALSSHPVSNAIALMVVVAFTVIGPLHSMPPVWLGVLPSVVQ
jgi:hypothetical protein